ncbi:MAG TPA: MgtC/SapB family protein, partial [Ilumatobacteraceae bacterium]
MGYNAAAAGTDITVFTASIAAVRHLTLASGVLHLLAALGLGAAVGLERELSGQAAGARTHALLALGTALFGLISIEGFARFLVDTSNTNVVVDVSRVASYVAAAVGFIGAGVITKSTNGVHGLTTAASLWIACAIGLACGLGLLALATFVAAASVVTLVIARPIRVLEHRFGQRQQVHLRMISPAADGATEALVVRGELQALHTHARITTASHPDA